MPFFVSSKNSRVIPPLPTWPKEKVVELTYASLVADVRKYSPSVNADPAEDNRYVQVPHDLLFAAITFTKAYERAMGLDRAHPEINDCDDFAGRLHRNLRDCAVAAGVSGTPLVATAKVISAANSLGISGTGVHRLVIARTGRGVTVAEPQTGQACDISIYPGRQFILDLRLA